MTTEDFFVAGVNTDLNIVQFLLFLYQSLNSGILTTLEKAHNDLCFLMVLFASRRLKEGEEVIIYKTMLFIIFQLCHINAFLLW